MSLPDWMDPGIIPNDATHYAGSTNGNHALVFYKNTEGTWRFKYPHNKYWTRCASGYPASTLTEIRGWSIHNNNFRLKNLTPDRAAELFNAWLKGYDRLQSNFGEFTLMNRNMDNTWSPDKVYRIAERTEREVFIETSSIIMHSVEGDGLINDITLGALFDSGARYVTLEKTDGVSESV